MGSESDEKFGNFGLSLSLFNGLLLRLSWSGISLGLSLLLPHVVSVRPGHFMWQKHVSDESLSSEEDQPLALDVSLDGASGDISVQSAVASCAVVS